MRYFKIILVLALWYQNAYTQTEFDRKELMSFAAIYLQCQTEQKDPEATITSLLEKHNISVERYADILKAGLEARKIPLSENEQNLRADIAKYNDELKNAAAARKNELCIKYQIPSEKYDAILNQYRSSIPFQNTLKPYFSDAIKSIEENEK